MVNFELPGLTTPGAFSNSAYRVRDLVASRSGRFFRNRCAVCTLSLMEKQMSRETRKDSNETMQAVWNELSENYKLSSLIMKVPGRAAATQEQYFSAVSVLIRLT